MFYWFSYTVGIKLIDKIFQPIEFVFHFTSTNQNDDFLWFTLSLYIYENHAVVSSVETRIMTGVVVLLFFVCLSSLAIVSKNFKANSFHDDKLFNDSLVSESPSMSVLYCASMCGPNCSYYGFNFKTKKCRAHTCFTLVNSVEEKGWRYYSSNDLDCKRKLI